MIKQYFNGIWKNRYILISLIKRDLMTKYRRSKLGVAWAILMPLGLAVIIGSIYSILFGVNPRVFIPTLFAGLNPWLFISSSMDGSTFAFIGAEGYIKQATVAPQIFPIRTVLVNLVNLLYGILTFFVVYLFLQPEAFCFTMLFFIPGLFIVVLFVVGLADISAMVTLSLRDFQPLQALVLQGMFYITPIIYPAQTLAERGFSIIFKINPFYYMLEIIRQPLLNGVIPSWDIYAIASILALFTFLIGVHMVMKNLHTIVFKL